MLYALISVLILLIQIFIWVIIGQAILSWLIAVNVINTQSDCVRQLLYWLDRVTEPVYRPIRRFMPDFGGIDFSPIVVILLMYLVIGLLQRLQLQTLAY